MTKILRDASLLAGALGVPADRVPEISERLEAIGGLHGLWHAGSESFEGLVDREISVRLQSMLEIAGRMLAPEELPSRIDSAASVAAYFHPRLSLAPTESFWALMLDARGRPLGTARIGEGTLTACLVHPREVFAPALRSRAASIIVVHNHPSGDPEPSDEDEALTGRLAEAGDLLGIPVLDHIVVARGGFRSLGAAHPSVHGKAR